MGGGPDLRQAAPGDVWATGGENPAAFLHDPDPSGADQADPYPWMQIWPPPADPTQRWRRTRDLPPGLRRIVHHGQAAAR